MVAGAAAQIDRMRYERDGYAIIADVVDAATLDALAESIGSLMPADGKRRDTCGLRHLLRDSAAARALAASKPMAVIAEAILGAGATAVRGLCFDKTDRANWHVGWHQDQTIAVERRIDSEELRGFGPWSVRDGLVHVRPPVDVLRRTTALRVHIDDCGADNGPLRVLPGAHRAGLLDAAAIKAMRDSGAAAADCCVGRGGVLAISPLLVHASSPARRPGRRRVAHLVYAVGDLPGGLRWGVC